MGAKLPKGIVERRAGANLQITFTYKNVLCREVIKGRKNNKADIKYCTGLLGEIERKISDGTFRYADYFPKSPKLKLFGSVRSDATLEHYLNEFLDTCEKRKLAYSSVRGYVTIVNRLSRYKQLPVGAIGTPLLKQFVNDLAYTEKLSNKTIRNTFSVFSSVMNLAVQDEVILHNVVKEFDWSMLVENKGNNTTKEVDPFTPAELDAILNAQHYPQIRNMIEFMAFTGVRPGECFALTWADVDFVHGTVRIDKSKVAGKRKNSTKTDAGNRTHDLDPRALDALQKQKPYTLMLGGEIFRTAYRDNNTPFLDDNQFRHQYWTKPLLKAGVRYRPPYALRHTYATIMISRNENIFWIADQMGHEDPTMIFRHYGSYLKEHGMAKKQFHQDKKPVSK